MKDRQGKRCNNVMREADDGLFPTATGGAFRDGASVHNDVCVRTDVPGDESSRINLRKLRSVPERKGEAVIELNGGVPFEF
jgi:hypothetical protein